MENKAMLTLYSHSGSLLFEEEKHFSFLPKVGETVRMKEEMDNTKEFIVLSVTYAEATNGIMYPYVQCESFYPNTEGAYTRLFYLRSECWVPGHCEDTAPTGKGTHNPFPRVRSL